MAKTKPQDTIFTSGRRKTAVARVFLNQTKGEFLVNDKDINDYFGTEKEKANWMRPFHLVGVSHPGASFNATVKVNGSGKSAQLEALVLAFSKALSQINEEYASILKRQGLLTRDSRMVERKKPFLRKARKSPQYSKR